MRQSKQTSLLESIVNTITGLLTSFIIQLIIYPFLGIKVTISENIIITAVFFAVSICRGYLIRRLFNKH